MTDVFPFKTAQTSYKALSRRGHLGSTARACLRGVEWREVTWAVGWKATISKLALLHHWVAVKERERQILLGSQKPQLSENLTPRRVLNIFWKMKCHVSEEPKNSLGLFCRVERQVLWHFRKYYRTSFLYPWTSALPFLWRWVKQWTWICVTSGAVWRGWGPQSSPSIKSSSSKGLRMELLATEDHWPLRQEKEAHPPPPKACFILSKLSGLWASLFL